MPCPLLHHVYFYMLCADLCVKGRVWLDGSNGGGGFFQVPCAQHELCKQKFFIISVAVAIQLRALHEAGLAVMPVAKSRLGIVGILCS